MSMIQNVPVDVLRSGRSSNVRNLEKIWPSGVELQRFVL